MPTLPTKTAGKAGEGRDSEARKMFARVASLKTWDLIAMKPFDVVGAHSVLLACATGSTAFEYLSTSWQVRRFASVHFHP